MEIDSSRVTQGTGECRPNCSEMGALWDDMNSQAEGHVARTDENKQGMNLVGRAGMRCG